MNTRPPKGRLRPPRPTDKFTIERWQLERIIEVERWLDRVDFFLDLFNDVEIAHRRWARLYFGIVVGGVIDNVRHAIKTLAPIARDFRKLTERR